MSVPNATAQRRLLGLRRNVAAGIMFKAARRLNHAGAMLEATCCGFCGDATAGALTEQPQSGEPWCHACEQAMAGYEDGCADERREIAQALSAAGMVVA